MRLEGLEFRTKEPRIELIQQLFIQVFVLSKIKLLLTTLNIFWRGNSCRGFPQDITGSEKNTVKYQQLLCIDVYSNGVFTPLYQQNRLIFF